MEHLKKKTLVKLIDPERKTIDGYASTFQWDRDQEKFVRGAWDLGAYLKNPVVLWAHDSSQPPIARNVSIVEDDLGLKAVTQFDPSIPRSMDYFKLFQAGFLNALSVGFMRLDYMIEDLGDGSGGRGLVITKAELFEYSAVSVPANPGALVTREIGELAMKAVGRDVIEVVKTKTLGDQFLVVEAAKGTEAALDEIARAAAAAQEEDLEKSLSRVIELAKIAKGSKLSETKRSLVGTAIRVFSEMLDEGKKELSPADMKKLTEALAGFGAVVTEQFPEVGPTITKTISQIETALKSRAA